MNAIYNRSMTVGISMSDASGRLGIPHAFAIFQDIAAEHAEILNVGFEASARRNLFWTTVRTRVHFYNRPRIAREVQLTTWPKAPGMTRCDRFYKMTADGETLIEGRTEWCVVNTQSGGVHPARDCGFPEDLVYCEDVVLNAPYARFRHNFADEDCAGKYVVPMSDIDLGRHMNNVAYLRMLLNSFSVAEIEAMHINEMEIIFLSSCFEGEELSIMRRKTDDGYEFGVRKPDGRYAALALIRAE